MPQLIPRAEALARIRGEGGEPSCLMCAIAQGRVGPLLEVASDGDVLLFLPRYVRRWGQLCAMPRTHVTSYSEWSHESSAAVHRVAHRAAVLLERLGRPRRVYLASTGSSAEELTQSSRHIHVHVIPNYDSEDRPASIFSWQEGVWVAEPEEWEQLRTTYVRAWADLGP
ncbi:MAG: hypothetical protein SFX73_17325 [Kofleriaceae bacterium]|nr:hypothetical protein [Kofleriaceae bacterium]